MSSRRLVGTYVSQEGSHPPAFTRMLPDSNQVMARIQSRGIISSSVLAHLALLALLLLYRHNALLLKSFLVADGNSSKSYRVVYVAPDGRSAPEVASNRLTLPPKMVRRKLHGRVHQVPDGPPEAEIAEKSSTAGSRFGTTITGPISGHEVRLALPRVFPDPPIHRSELPEGLQGDIVVEITIDAHGDVVETKVLQAIGHGLDEKVLATLRTWRFTPATLDGVPIASKHDVHFHFPS